MTGLSLRLSVPISTGLKKGNKHNDHSTRNRPGLVTLPAELGSAMALLRPMVRHSGWPMECSAELYTLLTSVWLSDWYTRIY